MSEYVLADERLACQRCHLPVQSHFRLEPIPSPAFPLFVREGEQLVCLCCQWLKPSSEYQEVPFAGLPLIVQCSLDLRAGGRVPRIFKRVSELPSLAPGAVTELGSR